MEQIIFGKTGLKVGRTGFGCIPIQRISYDESTALLRRAYDNGVTVFDTANGYTTSEERIGIALGGVRKSIVLCTKSSASNPTDLMANIENSLTKMQTDYIDVFQFHNPSYVPKPDEENGMYETLLTAKKQGKIRHIAISAHKKEVSIEAVTSGLYDVLQFPFSYLSTPEEMAIAGLCQTHNVGILGMKGLCGGILTNAKAAFAYLREYENIVPIWGIQETAQLDEFISYEKIPPVLDDELQAVINTDREALAETFCRACGYCLPCPADIPIPMAARMTFLLRRMRKDVLQAENWQEQMRKIDNCTHCEHCKKHCPYELDVPVLLREHQHAYFASL